MGHAERYPRERPAPLRAIRDVTVIPRRGTPPSGALDQTAEAARAPDLAGAGAAPAFGRLFDEHYGPLHRYLARRVGEHAAEDLAAETFLVAYQKRYDFRPECAPIRSWLYGIATNLLRRQARTEVRRYRATARAAGREAGVTLGHDAAVSAMVDAQAVARELAAGLARLSPGDRDVLLLISWARLDHAEVAAALGIPLGTVRSRLHRVRTALRKGMTPVEEDGDA